MWVLKELTDCKQYIHMNETCAALVHMCNILVHVCNTGTHVHQSGISVFNSAGQCTTLYVLQDTVQHCMYCRAVYNTACTTGHCMYCRTLYNSAAYSRGPVIHLYISQG